MSIKTTLNIYILRSIHKYQNYSHELILSTNTQNEILNVGPLPIASQKVKLKNQKVD